MPDTSPNTTLRQLYLELARQLPSVFTFKELAGIFYKHGIIQSPESPYPSYEGSKYDYILNKLSEAQHNEDFLRGVPGIIFDFDEGLVESSLETSQIHWLLKKMGYIQSKEADDHGVTLLEAPDDLSMYANTQTIALQTNERRLVQPNLPTTIQGLVDELNDNISRGNVNAAALLVRKVLTNACFLAMKKAGKETALKNTLGEDLELNTVINLCQQEFKISSKVMARIRSAKWIGDSANHSYLLRINEADVETAITGLRLLLAELFATD